MFDKSLINFIRTHLDEDVLQLILHQDKFPNIDIRQAVKCIEGHRKLKNKLPAWANFHDVMIPDPVMVEQASSYETALYKTRFIPSGDSIILDMSGGLGVDTSLFASATTNTVHYLEKDIERAKLASYNFSAMGLYNIKTHQGTAETEGLNLIKEISPDLIFIDPDRRALNKKRSYFIEDSTPNIINLLPQIKAINKKSDILIKLSPMIDIRYLKQALKQDYDLHILSLNRECKELLVHITAHTSNQIYTIELFKNSSFILEGSSSQTQKPICLPKTLPYLYDLYPSVGKVGIECFPCFSEKVVQPHPNTHLYFSEELIEDFPGRKFRIIHTFQWQKSLLKELRGKQMNIIVKNLPMTPEGLAKELKISDGGTLYLFCFPLGEKGRRHILVAERIG